MMFDLSFLQATIRATTPILLAGLAAVITQQAGILNIGVEGIMLMSAFVAVFVSYISGSWILALLAAVAAGVLIAVIIGVAHIRYKADIFAIGMAVNTMILALTKLLLQELLDTTGSFYSSALVQLPRINFTQDMSTTAFGNFALMDVFSWVLVAFIWWLTYKTIWGLRLRSVGSFTAAATSVGLNANRIKMEAIIISGVIGGLAGAHLSLGYSAMFVENMVSGRGFMGVAAMLFGGGNPLYTFIGCLIFGAADSLGARLQTQGWPSQFMQMVPYIATVAVLTAAAVRGKLFRAKTGR